MVLPLNNIALNDFFKNLIINFLRLLNNDLIIIRNRISILYPKLAECYEHVLSLVFTSKLKGRHRRKNTLEKYGGVAIT